MESMTEAQTRAFARGFRRLFGTGPVVLWGRDPRKAVQFGSDQDRGRAALWCALEILGVRS